MAENPGIASGPIALHLRIRVLSERRNDFLAFLSEAIPFYEAPGGIRIVVLQSRDDPDDFIEVVEYQEHEIYERDQMRVDSDPDMKERLVRWRGFLVGPVTVETYRVLEIQSLRVVVSPKADEVPHFDLSTLAVDDIGRLSLAAWMVV
jgi:hypothetical protein